MREIGENVRHKIAFLLAEVIRKLTALLKKKQRDLAKITC